MRKKKKSLTTISIYIRNLRTIYNEAIDDKIVSAELYPFGRNKYQIPQPANNKRALADADLIKIFQYKPEENTWEEYAKDMWILSLLCQGMNMKDIANLRFKNIQDDKIIFTREKTKRTKKAIQTPIVVYMDDEATATINRWGNVNTSPNQFVFPIYSDDNTPLKNLRNVEQQIKMINKYMRKIAATLEIKQDVTFYAARHSFATTLKRQGRSIEEIQEFLGHSDKKTTERYLSSFGDAHKRSIMNDFVKRLKTTNPPS
jgi:integrase